MARLLPLLLLPPLVPLLPAAEPDWRTLFNGRDLEGWTTTIADLPAGEDPDGLAQVRDGVIVMYPEVPDGATAPFGVITHDDTYDRFQLRFEYRWLGPRYVPRAEKLRDAGLIYHVKDAGSIWPAGVECQVQEGDTGDIVLINSGGLTWMHPDPEAAREGQGDPGMLPEHGGVPRLFEPSWPYVGRFEEADSPSGWNRVEVTVHGSDYAEHVVNGRTIARLAHFRDLGGELLGSGKICLQLEGARIAYRDIRIRELDPPLEADRNVVSLSAVRDQIARTRFLTISNPRETTLETPVEIVGRDADAFEILEAPESLAPGESGEWTLAFRPVRGSGRYSAGLRIGTPADGVFVVLQGVGLDAFEGEHEPPLQRITHAFGIPLDIGGDQLSHDTDAATIGDGIEAAYFTAAADGPVRVTPLARFSPKGVTPFGTFTEDSDELTERGRLADATGAVPDAHQTLRPPLEGDAEAIEFEPGDEPFGFFMKGHRYVSFTDSDRPNEAGIRHTARVFPVTVFEGRPVENACLVGFEEASNGDYQDALFLIENVAPRERSTPEGE